MASLRGEGALRPARCRGTGGVHRQWHTTRATHFAFSPEADHRRSASSWPSPRGTSASGEQWPLNRSASLAGFRQQCGQVLPHRLVQHRPLRLPSPVRPPVRSHQPLPSHTSPGHSLPSASHGPPWSPCMLVGSGPMRQATADPRWRRQVRSPPPPAELNRLDSGEPHRCRSKTVAGPMKAPLRLARTRRVLGAAR